MKGWEGGWEALWNRLTPLTDTRIEQPMCVSVCAMGEDVCAVLLSWCKSLSNASSSAVNAEADVTGRKAVPQPQRSEARRLLQRAGGK